MKCLTRCIVDDWEVGENLPDAWDAEGAFDPHGAALLPAVRWNHRCPFVHVVHI